MPVFDPAVPDLSVSIPQDVCATSELVVNDAGFPCLTTTFDTLAVALLVLIIQ